MGQKKLKLDKDIYERAKKYAELSGYSDVDEFIQHVIEKELAQIEECGESNEEVEKRLRGLGYIS